VGLRHQTPVVSHTRLDAELLGLRRQHSQCCNQPRLMLLNWMVAALLLSQMDNHGNGLAVA
jgi:hypothetical protein